MNRCNIKVAPNKIKNVALKAGGHCGATASQSTKTIPAMRPDTIRATTIAPLKITVRAQRMTHKISTADIKRAGHRALPVFIVIARNTGVAKNNSGQYGIGPRKLSRLAT